MSQPPRRYSRAWEGIQRVRLILQIILGLAIEVYDNLPHHHYAEGAAIGLGVLILTAAEVLIRWWRDPARQ